MSGLQFSPPQVPNPMPAAPGRAGSRRGKRGGVFWLMIVLLVLLALGTAGGGAAGFVIAAHRHPTQAQITDAGKREQAVLWERLSAGQIFPPSVGYPSALGAQAKATLVGIAPQAQCRSAVDAKAAPVLAAAGCVTVLRATYADEARLAAEGIPRRSQRSRIKRTQPTNLASLLPEAYPGMVRGGPAIFDTSLAPRLGTAAIRVDNLPLAVMSLPAPSWRRKSRASSVR